MFRVSEILIHWITLLPSSSHINPKVLVAYGERILAMGPLDPTQLYTHKYKGVTVCFTMLKCALLGDYVNFGVFQLYGDDALDSAFSVFFRLLVSHLLHSVCPVFG